MLSPKTYSQTYSSFDGILPADGPDHTSRRDFHPDASRDRPSIRAGQPTARTSLGALRLEQVLMLTLLLTQPNNYSAALEQPSRMAGRTPVVQAIELIRTGPEHPWTVATLAAEVAVSVRSLQVGFARSVGQTP